MSDLNKELLKRASTCIAGLNHLLSKRPDQFTDGVWPSYFTRAKGVEVWDLNNVKYVDMSIGGIGATVLGYAITEVDEAVKKVIDNGIASSLNSFEEVELAEVLIDLHPWANKCRFSRSGGEGMAIAIRIARAYTERDKILFCGYHGWHDWYLSANLSGESLDGHLLPGLSATGVPSCLKDTALPFEYNNIESLESLLLKHRGSVAAIVMEPIRNTSPLPGFLESVKMSAKKEGAVLIFDEISSAFRLATGGAHKVLKVEPDMAVFSKALGNGYPISAIIGLEMVMDAVDKTFISSTCWTERTGYAAALATIKKFKKDNTSSHLNEIGKAVQQGWRDIAKKTGVSIRVGGIPPLSHFEFIEKLEDHLVLKAYFIQEMLKKGFLASNIFYAMGAHTEEHVKDYLIATEEVFTEIFKKIKTNSKISDSLSGKASAKGFRRVT